MTKKDYKILAIITILYSIISFINLGNNNNPNTFLKLYAGDTIKLNFNQEEEITKVLIFTGERYGDYEVTIDEETNPEDIEEYYTEERVNEEGQTITYKYTRTKEDTNTENIQNINNKYEVKSQVFAWQEVNFTEPVKAKNIRINIKSVDSEYCMIGEVGVYAGDRLVLLSSLDETDSYILDEQSTVPIEYTYLNSSYFDEVYFPRSAYEYVHGLDVYETVHPPLGKLLQAIPVAIFGMAPFDYRLGGNICGILMVVVMFLFAYKMFGKTKFAVIAALLMAFDTFHFVQTRIGTVDSYLVLFIMISAYFMFSYIKSKDHKYRKLMLSGIFIACAISVKWSALYSALGLAIVFFIDFFKNIKEQSKEENIKTILFCFLPFVTIPLIMYFVLYLAFPNINGNHTNSFSAVIKQIQIMFKYHSELTATHPYSSKWYTWPFTQRNIFYFVKHYQDGTYGTISLFGNIFVWWGGVIAFFYMIFYTIFNRKIIVEKKKNEEGKEVNVINKSDKLIPLFLIIMILTSFLPYAFITRVMFLYHYFPTLPFVMLGIVYLMSKLPDNKKTNIGIIIYMTLVASFFIMYYPAITGIKTNIEYIKFLKLDWLKVFGHKIFNWDM